MKKITIVFFICAINLNAQIDTNRPTNTVRYQNIHFVIDQGAASVGTATVEQRHNKSVAFFKTMLLTDLRIKNLHIIPRADNEYVTDLSGVNGESDLGRLSSWINESTNNCDVRDIQVFATSSSGPSSSDASVVVGNAPGLANGFAIQCLYYSPRNDIVLGHEWAHSVGALTSGHPQGISHFNAMQVYDLGNPPSVYEFITTSTGWGFANNAIEFFSTPIEFNSSSISNGGNGYFTINLFDTNEDYAAHRDIPVAVMDNINDDDEAGLGIYARGSKKTNSWCGAVETSSSHKKKSSFTNTTSGIYEHYQNHLNYLREESVPALPIPQITTINGKINVTNLSDYNIQYANTTNSSYQNNYFTKANYQVYIYNANNTTEGTQIAGPIPLGQIAKNLPSNSNGNYVVRVYEVWSNSLSAVSNLVTLGIEEQELSEFILFPNPTNNILSIKADEQINTIEVYSVLGAKLTTIKNIKSKELDISMSQFSKGVYFIKINGKKHASIKQIVKN